MGNCVVCGKETMETAQVYIGSPVFQPDTQLTHYVYEMHSDYLCPDCVESHVNSGGLLKSAGFYLGLQLCWLSVVKSGLFSPVGIFAAAIALFGLFRLFVLACKGFYRRFLPDKPLPSFFAGRSDPQEDASELYKATIEKEENAYGRRVESLREYRRTHQE